MSNKRNHGDESNRAPYIEQPRKLVCNKMTPTDKAEKHMHPPPADAAAAPSIPDELRPYWQEDINFHSAGWWAELWKQSARAAVRDAFSLRSHKAAWEDWLQCDNPYAQGDAGMMEKAGWRYFDSIGIIATVSPAACSEPYLLL